MRNNNKNKQRTLFKSIIQQRHIGSKLSLNNTANGTKLVDRVSNHGRKTKVSRSKSLEQILDTNSSSSRSSAGDPRYNNMNNNSDGNVILTPNYWIADNTGLSRGNMHKKDMSTRNEIPNKLSSRISTSTSMKKSVSLHDVLEDATHSGQMSNIKTARDNHSAHFLEPGPKRQLPYKDQYFGSPPHIRKILNNDHPEQISSTHEKSNKFVSSYCTVDNRKHRGGLAKRQLQREQLQREMINSNGNLYSLSFEIHTTL